MGMYYLAQVGLALALITILVVSWLLIRRTRGDTGAWLRFLGALLLVLVRATDTVLFDPFVGVLRHGIHDDLTGVQAWTRVSSVGVMVGFACFAVGEVILYCRGGRCRRAEGTD